MVDTMLVVAPLRVCRQQWRQEAAKWEQFKDFKFSLLHGDKKDERLKDDADIWLINPEGCKWLSDKYFGRTFPFDIVAIDELTKFKNSGAERSKVLRARLKHTRYRWGLTGSLAPNGFMDLFGQMLMLDDGAALGRYITHYRDQYFVMDFDGFTYNLMPGADKRIVDRISPYWFKMDPADYAQLPELVPDPREITLGPAQQKLYNKMKRDMIAELPEGVITAANSAACYSKLSQMANGAVYMGDLKRTVSHIHDQKLEVIDELVEELNGAPLLIAYEFNHDLDRLKAWHLEKFKTELPYLGKGTTAKEEDQWVREWNQGKLPVLAAHPASAGHGLNMQEANACHVAWFSITWDYELYDQLIRRIRRSGNKALQVFNHLLVVKGSIDELKLAALGGKEMTQSGLMRALNAVILHDGDTQGTGLVGQAGDNDMKLSRPGGQQPAQQQQPTAAADKPQPKGWGSKANTQEAGGQEDQRDRIQEKINPEANRSAFTKGTQEAAAAIENGSQDQANDVQQPDPAPRTRRRAAAPAGDTAPAAVAPDAVMQFLGSIAGSYFKLQAVKIASQAHFAESFESSADLFALADEVGEYISKPF